MLEFVEGDFFEYEADIRVNTVNCVGVMGAGVALAFKRKYPSMYKDYAQKCRKGEMKPGRPVVWNGDDMFAKKLEIINFPTKDHWRKPSKYEYVESGLVWLADYLSEKSGMTVTLPALGCGHGGLDWSRVKALIAKYLDSSENRILVFQPYSSRMNEKGSVDLYKNSGLTDYDIEVIGSDSDRYPDRLKRYTNSDLYVFGRADFLTVYDVSVIASSKPSEDEKKIVKELVQFCDKACLSLLFGGSAFDKTVASMATGSGINTGVFLPTGIFNSAKKIIESKSLENPTLLSIGNPKESFDKKAYMPSVLSRIAISKSIVFTTDRLSWVKKNSGFLKRLDAKYYFIDYLSAGHESYEAMIELNAVPITALGGADKFSPISSRP